MKKLPTIIGITGFVLILGAIGDADCGTGNYIIPRLLVGCVMMVGGYTWARIRAARAEERMKASEDHQTNAEGQRRVCERVS